MWIVWKSVHLMAACTVSENISGSVSDKISIKEDGKVVHNLQRRQTSPISKQKEDNDTLSSVSSYIVYSATYIGQIGTGAPLTDISASLICSLCGSTAPHAIRNTYGSSCHCLGCIVEPMRKV